MSYTKIKFEQTSIGLVVSTVEHMPDASQPPTRWADTITRLRLRIENAGRINDGAELFDDLCSRGRGVR